MNDQLYLVTADPVYPDFPYESNDSALVHAFDFLFSLWKTDSNNPFNGWIGSGGCALIKPNWVFDRNPAGYSFDSLITHSSLIRRLIDFLAKLRLRRNQLLGIPSRGIALLLHTGRARHHRAGTEGWCSRAAWRRPIRNHRFGQLCDTPHSLRQRRCREGFGKLQWAYSLQSY